METNVTFKASGYQRYDVLNNGEKTGEVWKSYRCGYHYWKTSKTGKTRFTTREAAGQATIVPKG